MKRVAVFFLFFLFAHGGFCQTDTIVNTSSKPYDIKSCKITYQFYNGIQQGEKTIVFDDYGAVEKMTATTIMTGQTADNARTGDTTHEMFIKKNGLLYKINMTDGVGFKLKANETIPLNLDVLRPGQVLIGTDTVLEKECTVIEVFGSLRTWYWNRIPIKKQVVGVGLTSKVEEYAITVDENYSIGETEFEIPIGIKLK